MKYVIFANLALIFSILAVYGNSTWGKSIW
jgi:hypothetical protein